MFRVWTKRLGQRHYTRDGMNETFCGMPMLGNNYVDIISESEQKECCVCLKILKHEKGNENTDIKKLNEIQSKMIELIEEAEYIIKIKVNKDIYERAKIYWISDIKKALLNDNTEDVNKSIFTMQDTITEIRSQLLLDTKKLLKKSFSGGGFISFFLF